MEGVERDFEVVGFGMGCPEVSRGSVEVVVWMVFPKDVQKMWRLILAVMEWSCWKLRNGMPFAVLVLLEVREMVRFRDSRCGEHMYLSWFFRCDNRMLEVVSSSWDFSFVGNDFLDFERLMLGLN
ncbi:hypothetical protein Dimus_033869 [Dionaea muscipula]